MASFTTRVELHDEDANYEDLHTAMESLGFSRTIVADDGIEYHLPHAEYDFVSDTETSEDVMNLAIAAAESVTDFTFGVFVTESTDPRMIAGLKPVRRGIRLR